MDRLALYPWKSQPAAANMATDLLLLEDHPHPDALRLRPYGWSEAAFTFGRLQPWKEIEARQRALGLKNSATIRRPTGGGIVDHRSDWTYALVIPAHHPLTRLPAPESYRAVHAALADALVTLGQPAKLIEEPPPPPPGRLAECFVTPSPLDVVDPEGLRKLAGAAQKRNRHGLLFQGSLEKKNLHPGLAERLDELAGLFAFALAGPWQAKVEAVEDLNLDPTRLAEETATFASAAWNERR